MSSLGTLTVTLVEAHFTRDTAIGKMDPYVHFKSRDFKWKSETIKKGGKKPEWHGATFSIDVKYLGDDLEFEAMDDDPGKDEQIGEGQTKLAAFACKEHWEEWFDIEHKGKRAGKIHLKSHWQPAKAEAHGNDEMAEVQALMVEAVQKKKKLENELHDAREHQERNAAEGAARIAAVEAEAAGGHYDEQKRVADALFDAEVSRAETAKAE